MTNKDLRIYWAIRQLKASDSDNELSFYLQGCLDSGIRQDRLDKLIDKVNEDM